MREVINRCRTFKPWIVLENEFDVLRGTLVAAHLCDVHLREPAVILRCVVRLHFKVLPHLRKTFLTDRDLDTGIGCR